MRFITFAKKFFIKYQYNHVSPQNQKENDFVAQTYHFFIDNQYLNSPSTLIVTCIYPSNNPDEKLVGLRQDMHKILELPMDRSLMRRLDAFDFRTEASEALNSELFSQYLQNPHTSAKPSNGKRLVSTNK